MMPQILRLAFLPISILTCRALFAADALLIDPMEEPSFTLPAGKGTVETVEPGKEGRALKFSFPDGSKSVFATGRDRGKAEWDKAAGISFWLKGDGSRHCGGIEFVWNENYGLRYDYAFPLDGTEWRKIVIPWSNLIPVLPSPDSKPLDVSTGNAPSKLGALWFGKWWYWRDAAAQSFTIDEIRLEPVIALDSHDYKPAGAPLARVAAKLKAGQPITIVTMGDSLTDTHHWSNRETNWPMLLKAALKEQFKSEAVIVNPAMGGTQLRQNEVLIPYWKMDAPAPDLVTVFFGGNDWEAGMRGEMFFEAQKDTIDRIRRATGGKSDVLIMTTCPGIAHWGNYAELAAACLKAAADRNAGAVDVYKAFHADPAPDHAHLFGWDKVHLGLDGQKLIAGLVLDAMRSQNPKAGESH